MKKLLYLMFLSVSVLGANELEIKCNKGDLRACVDLAVEYFNSQHYAKAKDIWIKACDLGDQKGCDEYRKLNEQGY